MSDVVTENPLNRHISWEGLEHDITPLNSFFCRNHNPFPTPPSALEWAGHRLTVEDLGKMPVAEFAVTLECAGNGRTEFSPVPTGTPWGIRGMSTGRFAGVSVATLIERFPPAAEDRHIIFQGADLGKEGLYERSLTLEEAVGHSALIALTMNGEPLPQKHGAPFRLVVPGYYAMASVKWLQNARYSPVESDGYFQKEDYLVVYPDSDIPVRPATIMQPKSILVQPAQGDKVAGPVALSGKAWAGDGPISRVELKIMGSDGSSSVLPAELGEDLGPFAWRSFSAKADLPAGSYTAYSFCHANGQVQPQEARWNSQGYENNSAHAVAFEVER